MSTLFIIEADMRSSNVIELVRIGELCGRLGITEYSLDYKLQLGCVGFTIEDDAGAIAFKMACHLPIMDEAVYRRRIVERQAWDAKQEKLRDQMIKLKQAQMKRPGFSEAIKKVLKWKA